ncbi:hypothetical protein BGX28_010426, partial [Mortierella sp. GBA30]
MPRDRNDNTISLHVSGFKDSTRPSDLAELFEAHGRISDVYIPKDYYTGMPRGFAYVQYTDEEDARRVYESGEEFSLDGRKLVVQYAQGKRKNKEEEAEEEDVEEIVVAPALPTAITAQALAVIRAPVLAPVRLSVADVTAAALFAAAALVPGHPLVAGRLHPAVVVRLHPDAVLALARPVDVAPRETAAPVPARTLPVVEDDTHQARTAMSRWATEANLLTLDLGQSMERSQSRD